jgi:hypothetical protein
VTGVDGRGEIFFKNIRHGSDGETPANGSLPVAASRVGSSREGDDDDEQGVFSRQRRQHQRRRTLNRFRTSSANL